MIDETGGLGSTVSELLKEQEQAEAERDRYLLSMDRIVAQMAGPSWDGNTEITARGRSSQSHGGTNYAPDGRYFEYVSREVPALISRTPTWSVSTPLMGAQGDTAEAHRRALDQWSIDVDLLSLGIRAAVDMLINWSVVMVSPEEIPHSSPRVTKNGKRKPYRAGVERISQRNHVCDPLAPTRCKARYEGHNWVISKAKLVEMAEANPEDWHLEHVKELVEGVPEDAYKRPETEGMSRDEVLLTDWWIPEAKAPGSLGSEKGEFGSIFTFPHRCMYSADKTDPQHIRNQRPWMGHPDGPYVTFGVYEVPDSAMPLGPLTAADTNIQDLNAITRAIVQADKKYKRIFLTNSKALAKKVKKGEHDYVFSDANLAEAGVQALEFGGSTATQHAHREQTSAMVDRLLAQSEATQGTVTGVGSATENAIAANNRSVSRGYVASRFEQAMAQVGERAAFIHHHDDRVVFAVPSEDGEGFDGYEEEAPEDGEFEGGQSNSDDKTPFFSLQIAVRPKSMQKADEAAQRAATIQGLQTMAGMIPLMAQTPDSPWEQYWKMFGEALGVEELERLARLFLKRELPVEPFLQGDLGSMNQLGGSSGEIPLPSLSGSFGGRRGPAGSPAAPALQALGSAEGRQAGGNGVGIGAAGA